MDVGAVSASRDLSPRHRAGRVSLTNQGFGTARVSKRNVTGLSALPSPRQRDQPLIQKRKR